MLTKANEPEELAVEIRPGVIRPDWSVATTSAARQALSGRGAGRTGLLEHWSKPLDANAVWQTLLRIFVRDGRPPRSAEIAAATGLPQGGVTPILHELERRDLIGLQPVTEAIRFAYPWTTAASGHRVALGAHALWALRAIDALAAARMYRTDASITSACASCASKVYIATALQGRALRSVSPSQSSSGTTFPSPVARPARRAPRLRFSARTSTSGLGSMRSRVGLRGPTVFDVAQARDAFQ
jgi:alkylmercury lyase